jgi:DNA-binding response OmpR family regulator
LRSEAATTTLLLIEDHRDIAEMIAEYFEPRGFAIDHAADGITGLHLAVSNPMTSSSRT